LDPAEEPCEHHVAADEDEPECGAQEIILQDFYDHQQKRLHQHQEDPGDKYVVHKALYIGIQVRQPMEYAV